MRFILIFIILIFSLAFVRADLSLNGNDAIKINDSSSLDGFTQATWSIWANQAQYKDKAGFFGKYTAITGGRSYIIRTTQTNSIQILLSQDGTNYETLSSTPVLACGIRKNNEWVLLTITWDGKEISYYRNGVKCDSDLTSITKIHNSPSNLFIGQAYNIFFNGTIDDARIYNSALSQEQVMRLYNESVHGTNLGPSFPVLVYHKIETPADNAYKVSIDEFKNQMGWLDSQSFATITMTDYNNWKKGTFQVPEKPIMIVFEDGFVSAHKNAMPIMKQYGQKGVVTVITETPSYSNPLSSYMKWWQLHELKNLSWDFQSHSVTHPQFNSINESSFRWQLSESNKTLVAKLGVTPTSFIFPYDQANASFAKICSEYYDICWMHGGPSPLYNFKSTNGKEFQALKRINVYSHTSFDSFTKMLGKDANLVGDWRLDANLQDKSKEKNNGELIL